jgi:hypothetical protein
LGNRKQQRNTLDKNENSMATLLRRYHQFLAPFSCKFSLSHWRRGDLQLFEHSFQWKEKIFDPRAGTEECTRAAPGRSRKRLRARRGRGPAPPRHRFGRRSGNSGLGVQSLSGTGSSQRNLSRTRINLNLTRKSSAVHRLGPGVKALSGASAYGRAGVNLIDPFRGRPTGRCSSASR